MNVNEYMETLEARLSKNFNVKRTAEVLNNSIDLYGRMEIHNEKYFASRNVKVWRAETYEYVLVKHMDSITEASIFEFQDFLKKAIDHFVEPHSEHMSTTITGVIVVNEFPEQLEMLIKQFKQRKYFAFSFKGWAELRLIAVDIHSNRVITNKKGKEVAEFYRPTMKDTKKPFHLKK